MMRFFYIPQTSFGQRLAPAAAAVALTLISTAITGCGMGTPTVNDGTTAAISLSGRVHGGQQAVVGAQIQLWTVGTSGYGSGTLAANQLVTGAAVLTAGSNGDFSISGRYTCPTANPAALTYITATGGNPGNGAANANLKLAAALGPCNQLIGTYIELNEVTTAAAAYALSQYFTTTYGTASVDTFGSPNTTQALAGITNAFATAATLANSATGVANASLTTNGTGGQLTITPEAAKLYTVADILAACVNSAGGTSGDGTACGTLFADSGPTGVTPTDTLQAAVLLNLNPTSNNANGSSANIAALFGLVTANAPFVGLTAQPTDWTIGVQYTGNATTMPEPQNIAIDASGNVWVVNNVSAGASSLNEITPAGSMTVDSQLVSGAATAQNNNPRNLAIDLSGNVWVPTSSSSAYLFEYTTGGAVNALAVGKSIYGVAIDASNNVWVSPESATATASLQEFIGGNLSTTSQVSYPVIGASTSLPSYLAFDTNGNLWISSEANLASNSNVVQATNLSSASCTAFPCTSGTVTYTNVTGLGTEPFGMAASANNMWVADAVGNEISSLTLTSPTVNNYGSTATVTTPRFPAVDGNGNIWVSNRGTGSVSEFSSNGTALSPASTATPLTPGFLHSGLASANGIGIDPSGNVWVANNTLNTNAYSIFEIVGAAAPAVTPLALALKNNAFGVKP